MLLDLFVHALPAPVDSSGHYTIDSDAFIDYEIELTEEEKEKRRVADELAKKLAKEREEMHRMCDQLSHEDELSWLREEFDKCVDEVSQCLMDGMIEDVICITETVSGLVDSCCVLDDVVNDVISDLIIIEDVTSDVIEG